MEEKNTVQVAPAISEPARREFPLFRIIYRNLLLILIITILFGIGGTVYAYLRVKPSYTATCDVILSVELTNKKEDENTSLARSFMPTIADLITTRKIMATAAGYHGLGIYGGAMKISYDTSSLIFSIGYSDVSIQSATEKLQDVLRAIKEELTTGTEKPINVKSIGFTETQNSFVITSYSDKNLYIVLGVVIGLAVGIIISLLTYILDNKVKDINELEELSGTSVLAMIEKQEN